MASIEGRLAKLEQAWASKDDGKEGLIFAMQEREETREQFDARVQRLIRETGCPEERVIVFTVITH